MGVLFAKAELCDIVVSQFLDKWLLDIFATCANNDSVAWPTCDNLYK